MLLLIKTNAEHMRNFVSRIAIPNGKKGVAVAEQSKEIGRYLYRNTVILTQA